MGEIFLQGVPAPSLASQLPQWTDVLRICDRLTNLWELACQRWRQSSQRKNPDKKSPRPNRCG